MAIALGILAASGQLPAVALENVEFLGELALSGAIRPVQGVLPAALAARAAGRALVVPVANAEEACLASGLTVIAVEHLLQVVAHFAGRTVMEPYIASGLLQVSKPYPDLSDVQGQNDRPARAWGTGQGAHVVRQPGTRAMRSFSGIEITQHLVDQAHVNRFVGPLPEKAEPAYFAEAAKPT